MDARKRKIDTSNNLTNMAEASKKQNPPSIEYALCLDEMIYSKEAEQLRANHLHADDFYEAYDVLGFFIAEPVQLDIIREIIEGMNKLLHQQNVRALFNARILTAKEVLDRFLYVRTDNDYEFTKTVKEVIKLANILFTPAAEALINKGQLHCRKVVSAFLECSENEFDFKHALAIGKNQTSVHSNNLFQHPQAQKKSQEPHVTLHLRKT